MSFDKSANRHQHTANQWGQQFPNIPSTQPSNGDSNSQVFLAQTTSNRGANAMPDLQPSRTQRISLLSMFFFNRRFVSFLLGHQFAHSQPMRTEIPEHSQHTINQWGQRLPNIPNVEAIHPINGDSGDRDHQTFLMQKQYILSMETVVTRNPKHSQHTTNQLGQKFLNIANVEAIHPINGDSGDKHAKTLLAHKQSIGTEPIRGGVQCF